MPQQTKKETIIQDQLDRSSYSNSNRKKSYSNNRLQNYSNDRSRNYSIACTRNYQKYFSKKIIIKIKTTDHEKNLNTIEVEKTAIKNRLSRNFSSSSNWNNSKNWNRKYQNHSSSTPKCQRQFDQVRTTSETTPDPPRFENDEKSELQKTRYKLIAQITTVEPKTC